MENIQETIAEEVTELALFEEVKGLVLPKRYNIDGVILDMEELKERVTKIKTMKIDGFSDEEGYKEAVETKKLISKLRTTSKKWRENKAKPVNDFLSQFKKFFDDAGALCSEAETYLDAQIKPIDDYKEIEKQKEEKEKERIAGERAELVVQCGGVFDGKGTYNFPHDTATFILADKLKSMNEEQWQVEYKAIQDSWKVESDRLQAIEDDKKAEETKLQSQVADLNEERTEMRKEILDMKGFTILENGTYTHVSGINVLPSQILNLSKDDWTALLNPPAKVEVITPKVEETIVEAPELDLPDIDLPADLPQSLPEVLVAEINKPEPEMVEPREDSETISCEFQFSKADPFLEFVIGNGFSMRLYPEELEKEALEGLETATNGIAVEGEEGNLLFALFQNK